MRRCLGAILFLWAGCNYPAMGAMTPFARSSSGIARASDERIPLPRAEPQPPVWVGELTSTTEGRRFALKAATGGGEPQWLGLGDVCNGYRLAGYATDPETLTLRRGEQTVALTLGPGASADAAAIPATAVPTAAEAIPPANALDLAAAEARRRDGWGAEAQCEPARRHGAQWWVLVQRVNAGRREARMVILSADGRVIDYWRV